MTGRPALIVFSSSEIGGAERSLTRMALTPEGRAFFDLATLDREGPWADWVRGEGRHPFCLGQRKSGVRHGRWGVASLCRLIRLVCEKRYKAVYIIGFRASWALRFLRPFLCGAKLVQGVRSNPFSASFTDRLFRGVERWAGFLIDHYVCNSDAARQVLVQRAGVPVHKTSVIPNGLDRFPEETEPYAIRHPVVVTVANFHAGKGYEPYLEQVVLPLNRARPEVRFVFAGRDDMGGRVQAKIRDLGLSSCVTCAGFQVDVSPLLQAARLFVLPSFSEGCPTSVIEAMAHGLPVIAFSVGGIPELIETGREGWLAPSGDFQEMFQKVQALLDHPEEAEAMGQAGRKKMVQTFTIQTMTQKHVALFSALIEGQGHPLHGGADACAGL